MPGSRVAIRTVSTFYESNQGGDRAELMSPFGTKRTFQSRSVMSAFGGKADMARQASICLSRSRPCVRPVRVVFEGRQAKLVSDPHDVCLVHTPRLDSAGDKLCASKALCARRQRLAVDVLDFSIVRFDLSNEFSKPTLHTRITCL